MGCVKSKLSSGQILDDIEAVTSGSVTVFADGKFVVPQGQNALIWMRPNLLATTLKSPKSSSKDGFEIKDMSVGKDGNVLFEAVREERTLIDAKTREPVLVMKQAMLQMANRQIVCSGDGKTELFKVASNLCRTKQYTIGLKNDKGEKMAIESNIDSLAKEGHVCLGDLKTGHPIAKVRPLVQTKNFKISDVQGFNDYFIEIAPGADVLLVIAVVLAHEQIEVARRAIDAFGANYLFIS